MLALDLSSTPAFFTPRLHLRALHDDDAPAVLALRSDPTCMRFIPRPIARSLEDARAHIDLIRTEQAENRNRTWAIALRDTPTLIGIISLLRIRPEHHRAEVGYMLLPVHWGRGLMSEALAAVTDHALHDLRFRRVEAVVDPRNQASIAVLERNGYAREGLLRENIRWEDAFLDSVVYAQLAPSTVPADPPLADRS